MHGVSILGIWAMFAVLFGGSGLLVQRAFGLPLKDWQGCLNAFWVGWAAVIALLQAWHLVLPLQWPALIPIAAGAAVGVWTSRDDLRRLLGPIGAAQLTGAALLIVITLWVAVRALDAPYNYDTGLYHLSALRWTQAYPVVPGLGNLHDRLAFNQSYFLYLALLEAGPWRISATHLASGLLLVPLLGQVVLSGWRLCRHPREATPHDTFCVLVLPAIARLLIGPNLSSSSTDLAIETLGIVVSARLLSLLTVRAPHATIEDVVVIALLTIIGITIKLSFAGFALGVFAAMGGAYLFGRTARMMTNVGPRALATLVVATVLIIGPWLVHGLVLSGYPAFPLSIGSLPVEWRVPPESVDTTRTWIVGFARASHPDEYRYQHLRELEHSWIWVGAWFSRIVVQYYNDIVVPVVLAAASGIVAVSAAWRCRPAPHRQHVWLTRLWFLPPLVSLAFWFTSAPDPRFIGVALVILAPGILALTLDDIEPARRGLYLLACVVAAVGLTGAIILRAPPLQTAELLDAPTVALKPFRTESGLTLLTPETPDQCWDAPLLCTPYPNQRLRLRAESLRSGFVVDPPATAGGRQ